VQLAELLHALPEPRGHVAQILLARVQKPGPLDVDVEARDVDVLRAAPVCRRGDRARQLLLAGLGADGHHLPRLDVGTPVDGELGRLARPSSLAAVRVGRPLPADVLLRHYREAERRFHVRWQVLAALNFVESAFNKLRNRSAAGAQGPMQFLPSTWRSYGLGGNVHDPHDAILGAANYLHAAGAPRSYRRALFAYNPSPLYVDAVLRYARQIERDRRSYFDYYSRQVFVHTPAGVRRVTGPRR